MNELKPCPFCGGEPEVVLRPDNLWGGYFCNVFCRCDNKYYAEANKSARGADESDVYNKAITAWNSRTGNDTNVATNADRIRSMSDEELARFLGDEPPYFSTYEKYLDWLKQPVKEK